MNTQYQECRQWIERITIDGNPFSFLESYRAYIWWILKELKYLYDDMWMPDGVADDLLKEGKIKMVGLAIHQGERMIKYKFTYLKYPTKRAPIPINIKRELYESVPYMCNYCGSNRNIQIDHIIPVSKGGDNSIENLQLLCRSCNMKKFNH